MILNNRFEEPYNKFPNDGPLPLLSKPIIKSKLSKKFWLYSQYLENENLINSEEEFSSSDNYNVNNDNNNIEPDNMNFRNKDEKEINIKGFKTDYRKQKFSGNKCGRINNKYNIEKGKMKKKNIIKHNFKNDADEINDLNDIIYNLQLELNRQDFIINNQINEKMKLQRRIYELEQVLKNFC